MKRYLYKLVSEVLGNMFTNGQLRALPKFNISDISVPKENFGDYSLSVALAAAKEAGMQPKDVAEIIARELKTLDTHNVFSEIQVVNGFINLTISRGALVQNVLDLQNTPHIDQTGMKEDGAKVKVVFEYSSPNTNKPLHIGHTRNDVYGKACINLLRATGHDVIATEIVNDRGIHIMKSMLMYLQHGNNQTPESEGMKSDHFVGKYYAMFETENAKYKEGLKENESTELELEAQEMLRKWEAGDKAVRALWKQMNTWFFEGVKQTYAKEGSEFDEVEFESDIYDKGREVVLDGVKKGVFVKEGDGSTSVDLTEQGLDKKYLLRKDGTTLYITQDIYLWHLRNQKHQPDMAIVTTSAEQAYHFKVLSKVFALLQYPWAENFLHLPYEHVFLGKNKMSSRAGNAVSADDLLLQTKEKVLETMRNSQKAKASADDAQLVEDIAFGAIKYGYLKYDCNTKIFFDLDETIAIEGNTGPYLQYAYARIMSIMEKAENFQPHTPTDLNEPAEQRLMRFLLHYNETVVNAAKEFRPNIVCNYIYELASLFSAFYDQVSVLNAESESLKMQRLTLLKSVATVIEHGLKLLGIKAPQKI